MTFREAFAVSIFNTASMGIIGKLNSEQRRHFFAYLDSIKYKDIFLQVHLALDYIEQNFDFERIENEDKKEVSDKLIVLKMKTDKKHTNNINEIGQNNKTANNNIIPWNEHYGGKHYCENDNL